jgi:flagella basal body P-ring formation protein FlgA
MMNKLISSVSLPALLAILSATTAFAAPVLKSEVSVNHPIVTIGDMFDDAGLLAETALFRAPAPGTTGMVSLEAVRAAAARAGLDEYLSEGVLNVKVERRAAVIDTTEFTNLIEGDLNFRGLLPAGAEVEARFDGGALAYNAEDVAVPVTLTALRWQPGSQAFAARFSIAGIDAPVDVTGRIDLMVEVPHLASTLKAGAVLTPADIEMKKVPFDYADQSGIETAEDLIGKELKRNGRAGLMLKAADVTERLTVRRNTQVTVLLKTGPMTLTVVGQSLADASAGQPVQVMNTVTKKILNGVAMADGTVAIATAAQKLQVAGL